MKLMPVSVLVVKNSVTFAEIIIKDRRHSVQICSGTRFKIKCLGKTEEGIFFLCDCSHILLCCTRGNKCEQTTVELVWKVLQLIHILD